MNLWISDPKSKTKEKSVTLTLLVYSFLVLLVASTLHLSGMTESTSSLLELFYATSAMYLGRRFSFNGKMFNGDNPETPQQKDPP